MARRYYRQQTPEYQDPYEKQWLNSPEYARMMEREATHAKLQEEYFRKQQNPEYVKRLNERADLRMKLKEKAEYDAATFEKQYTVKQKLEIAKWNRIKQDIDRNPSFSDREREAVKRAADFEIMGIKPSELPKTTPWPKGKGIGDAWKDADGSLLGRDPDGRLRLIQRWDQGPDHQSMKEEQDSLKAQAKLQVDLEKEKRKGVFDLMSKGMFDGVDEFGKPKMRRVDAREARTIVEQLYSEQQQGGEGWAQQAEKAGMKVQDEDRKLPPDVGYAKTYIQNMREMYGSFDKLPPEAKDAYRAALDAVREYARKR